MWLCLYIHVQMVRLCSHSVLPLICTRDAPALTFSEKSLLPLMSRLTREVRLCTPLSVVTCSMGRMGHVKCMGAWGARDTCMLVVAVYIKKNTIPPNCSLDMLTGPSTKLPRDGVKVLMHQLGSHRLWSKTRAT